MHWPPRKTRSVQNCTGARPLYHATIAYMWLAIWAMRVVVALFFIGLAGSSVVVVISFIEDWKELFGKD